MKLRFVSRNEQKLAEAKVILGRVGIEVVLLKETIEDLQTIDASRLVRDKAFRAFFPKLTARCSWKTRGWD